MPKEEGFAEEYRKKENTEAIKKEKAREEKK